MLSKIITATLAAALLALSGCAPLDAGHNTAQHGQDTAPTARTTISAAAMAARQAAAKPHGDVQPLESPAFVEFDMQDTALSDSAQTQVTQLAAPARRAAKVVVTGYADRSQTKNAKDVALARAVKVKGELVKKGVLAKNIRLRYATGEARNAAKIEWSGDAPRLANSETRAVKN